jgi:hypothetical protein
MVDGLHGCLEACIPLLLACVDVLGPIGVVEGLRGVDI